MLAGTGGLLAGFASRLARGCTSGQALSGGALLLDWQPDLCRLSVCRRIRYGLLVQETME